MQRIPFDMDHPEFFCPITGEQITFEEDFIPSPATVFAWISLAEEFEYVNDEFKILYDDYMANPENDHDFEEFLDDTECHNVVVFEITTGAPAGGLSSCTAYIGIDKDHNVTE